MPGRAVGPSRTPATCSIGCRRASSTRSRRIRRPLISIARSSARTMRSSVLIGRLTADLLTRGGAIVDSGPGQALDVMAESALRGVLGLREFERLSFEPGVAGATFIDYDAPLLDRLASVVNGLGRVARVQPPTVARKPIDATAVIDRGVTIHNGVHRYHSHVAVDATYVGATFEYTVLADERMGGVVTTWVNPATRSTASFESK